MFDLLYDLALGLSYSNPEIVVSQESVVPGGPINVEQEGIFLENLTNTMAADAIISYVTRSCF